MLLTIAFLDVPTLTAISAAIFGAIASLTSFFQRSAERSASAKVEEAEKRAYSVPTKQGVAEIESLDLLALFDLYSKQIARYQVETRFRAVWSFVWAVVAMLGGLTLLLMGSWHVFQGGDSNPLPASAVTIVGAAVSGFIAKTFLDVHRTSLVQLNHYFKQPVLNSHILTAQRLTELLEHGDQQETIKDIIKTVLLLIPAEQAQSAVLGMSTTKRGASASRQSKRTTEKKNSDTKRTKSQNEADV